MKLFRPRSPRAPPPPRARVRPLTPPLSIDSGARRPAALVPPYSATAPLVLMQPPTADNSAYFRRMDEIEDR